MTESPDISSVAVEKRVARALKVALETDEKADHGQPPRSLVLLSGGIDSVAVWLTCCRRRITKSMHIISNCRTGKIARMQKTTRLQMWSSIAGTISGILNSVRLKANSGRTLLARS